MLYINKKTGALIDINSKVTSDYWEQVEKPATPTVKEEAPKKKTRSK